ncbi:M56 family metallopeptidase [Dysgonomonas reticulitermitis]
MTTYLLQMAICSLLLLAVYYFFLEKETMHRFKRFYLLFSLVLSITIPFISIEISGSSSLIGKLPFTEVQVTTNKVAHTNEMIVVQEETNTANPINILFIGYITIAGIVLSRFLINIARLIITIKKNEHIVPGNMKIVLTDAGSIPYSFGNYIFLNKNEYKAGLIEEEVLTHEMTHVRQCHSLDILFIELLLILFWFNPILYLYKNRIKLNHEFLADEGVISAYNDVPHYQMILIDKISRQNSLSLTSNFNYLLTKKRLTMMTKKTSARIAVMKRAVILPLFLLFAFAFCTKKVNEQTKTDEGNAGITEVKNDNVEIKKDTIKAEEQEVTKKETVTFTPPKIVKDGEKAPPPPPPPIKAEKKETVYFTPPKIKDGKKIPPPPPMISSFENIDFTSRQVGDKITDNQGKEWTVANKDPLILQIKKENGETVEIKIPEEKK